MDPAGTAAVEDEPIIELWRVSECFLYKVPPVTAAGFKAADWNLEKPSVTGSLKLLSKGPTVRIEIYGPKSERLVSCPVKLDETPDAPGAEPEFWVQVVKDSSRYFAVRVIDPKSKASTFLGLGFRERNAAFEFQSSLNDHFKRVKRQRGIKDKEEEEEEAEESSDVSGAASGVSKLALTGSVKLKLGGVLQGSKASGSAPPTGGSLKLAAPPAAPKSVAPAATQPASAAAKEEDDTDWGDFES